MRKSIGRLLRDASRQPYKASVARGRVAKIIHLTIEPPSLEELHWTLRAMVKVAGVSASTVQAIWKAHGLSPHRWRSSKLDNYAAHKNDKVHALLGRTLDLPLHAPLVIAAQRRRGLLRQAEAAQAQHSVFHSFVDLQAAINRFITEYPDDNPKPFICKAQPTAFSHYINNGSNY